MHLMEPQPPPQPPPPPQLQPWGNYQSDPVQPLTLHHDVVLEFDKKKRKWYICQPVKLRNNILYFLGLIELVNILDFPANVWSDDPPLGLDWVLGIAGVAVFSTIVIVIWDACLSNTNLRCLTSEWDFFDSDCNEREDKLRRTARTFRHLNRREIGVERVDRIAMEILTGLGAVMVAVGCWVGIKGAEDSVLFVVSDVLTGYAGNFPCCLYGLVNLGWSSYMLARSFRQEKCTISAAPKGSTLQKLISERAWATRWHSCMSLVASVVSSVFSMLTYTKWWAYPVLAACSFLSLWVNIYFRWYVGYDRPCARWVMRTDDRQFVSGLRYSHETYGRLGKAPPFYTLIPQPFRFQDIVDFIADHDLLEDFFIKILRDQPKNRPARLLLSQPHLKNITTFNANKLKVWGARDAELESILTDIAIKLINEKAKEWFRYQQRWLVDAFVAYMVVLENERKRDAKRPDWRSNLGHTPPPPLGSWRNIRLLRQGCRWLALPSPLGDVEQGLK